MQKSIITTIICTLLSFQLALSQKAVDFSIVDSGGQEHKLYEDYLDKGTTVLVKLFFVDCPPCQSIAPFVQDLYEEWGSGQYDVQFFELSTKMNDSNADVAQFKIQFGTEFPGAGFDGGAITALQPFFSGQYGSYFGTPSFAVIAPNGDITYGISGPGNSGKMAALDEAIRETGAVGDGTTEPDPSIFDFDIKDAFNKDLDNVILTIESEDGSVSYEVDASQDLNIVDFENDYPNITDPYFRIKKTDEIAKNLSALDLFVIVKHILNKEIITDDAIKNAADTNGDNKISALDLFTLQRVILGKDPKFPNRDSYEFTPHEIQLNLNPGESQDVKFTGVKIGDVNGI